MKPDFIEVFYGMSRMGKTTRALEILPKGPRSIVYTAQFTNEKMMDRYKGRFIYDTPEYLDNLEKYLEIHKDILILKTQEKNDVFDRFWKIKNTYILLDDVTMIVDENWPLMRFLASVGMNENKVIITTHVPQGDMPKKARTIAVKVNIVGPWDSEDDIDWLYRNNRNILVDKKTFEARLKSQKWGEIYTIKA